MAIKIVLEQTMVLNELQKHNGGIGSRVVYNVVKLTNTTIYQIKEKLEVDEVQGLCDLEDWTVEIK